MSLYTAGQWSVQIRNILDGNPYSGAAPKAGIWVEEARSWIVGITTSYQGDGDCWMTYDGQGWKRTESGYNHTKDHAYNCKEGGLMILRPDGLYFASAYNTTEQYKGPHNGAAPATLDGMVRYFDRYIKASSGYVYEADINTDWTGSPWGSSVYHNPDGWGDILIPDGDGHYWLTAVDTNGHFKARRYDPQARKVYGPIRQHHFASDAHTDHDYQVGYSKSLKAWIVYDNNYATCAVYLGQPIPTAISGPSAGAVTTGHGAAVSVTLTGDLGDAVDNWPVDFSITSGGGVLSTLQAITDDTGTATVTYGAPLATGSVTIQAQAVTL